MNKRDCDQTRCAFHKTNGASALCPICNECGSQSNTIDEDCVNCWNCLKDEGYIRSGIPKGVKQTQSQRDKITLKVIR